MNEVLSGEASHKRRLSCFQLDAFIITKVDKFVNELSGLLERFRFFAADHSVLRMEKKFSAINFFGQDVPDTTILLHFRRLLEDKGINW